MMRSPNPEDSHPSPRGEHGPRPEEVEKPGTSLSQKLELAGVTPPLPVAEKKIIDENAGIEDNDTPNGGMEPLAVPMLVKCQGADELEEVDLEALLGGKPGEDRYKGKKCLEKFLLSWFGLCWGEAHWVWSFLCCPFILVWRSILTYFVPCILLLLNTIFRCTCGALCKDCLMFDDRYFPKGVRVLGDGTKDTSKIAVSSLKAQSEAKIDSKIDWVRAGDMIKDLVDSKDSKINHAALFYGPPSWKDVNQGNLGDCWLVSAMASIGEYPQAISNVFSTRRYNEYGKYTVKLYDGRYDEWVDITIDDWIPVYKGKKRPVFLTPKGHALWALLLEKAFAKFCSGYSNLDGGHQLWAFQAMTGDVCFALKKDKSNLWARLDLTYEAPPRSICGRICSALCFFICPCWRTYRTENPRKHYGMTSRGEKFDSKRTWKLLEHYHTQKALISCSASAKGEEKGKDGIVRGHAYSVLNIVEKGEFKMLQLRNPWGKFEWKGAWSDGNAMWTKHPDVARACGYDAKTTDKNDGAFWMEFNDWKRIFDMADICDRSSNRDLALDVNEEKGILGVCEGCLVGCATFWCLCQGCYTLFCAHKTKDETADVTGCCDCLTGESGKSYK